MCCLVQLCRVAPVLAAETKPIKSFEDLLALSFGKDTPQGCNGEGDAVLQAGHTLHFSELKVSLNGERRKKEDCKKTLVCHDLKGGYGDDRFHEGSSCEKNYSFHHWLQTDIFVYFSHHFVTIPPVGWIKAARRHGTTILGTIITEWTDGESICSQILKSDESMKTVISQLCNVCVHYGFGGYLVNIENKIETPNLLVKFLRDLTVALKQVNGNNFVIWYDSVIYSDGSLKWQNELNGENKCFFDVCDGIFLNYAWDEEKLQKSKEIAGSRQYDVFVGIDIFGRGCYGGGGLNSYKAVEKVAEYNLSYALFAPGWSYECHQFHSYPFIDNVLWTRCAKYFNYRCITSVKDGQQKNSAYVNNNEFQIILHTDFCRGYGKSEFCMGKVAKDTPWFDLRKLSFQPFIQPCHTFTPMDDDCDVEKDAGNKAKVIYDTTKGFFGGGSLLLQNSKRKSNFINPQTSAPIWFPLDIKLQNRRTTLAVLTVWKSVSIENELKVYLETVKNDVAVRKILLGSLDHLAASVRGTYNQRMHFMQFLKDYQFSEQMQSTLKDISFSFQKNNYDENEINGWRISCFLFDVDNNLNSSYIQSIKIAAEGEVSLGFLSVAQIIK